MLNKSINRDELDYYLKELAKTHYIQNRKADLIEIIIVGGASIVLNYSFREATYDVDCMMSNLSALKRSINLVTDRFGLQNGWINSDFKTTSSYSDQLREYSSYYRKWYNLEFRTISAEYLIAMKLVSARIYKNDLNDILGILNEHKIRNNAILKSEIEKAVINLYLDLNKVSKEMWEYLDLIL